MFFRATLGYFCAPPGHYWEWDLEQGRTDASIVLPDDRSTLLLLQELTPLLRSLVPEGLPPLGAVMLLVAAASEGWDAGVMRQRLFAAARLATGNEDVPHGVVNSWRHVGRGLEQVHALPQDLRSGGIARSRLLRTIFEGAFNRLPESISESIMGQLEEASDLSPFQDRTPDLNGVARILRDLSVLEKAFDKLPMAKLEQHLRTGTDSDVSGQLELPLREEDTAPVPEVPADLLKALENEGGELAQVAGLVRRLSAILHVPKPVASREDLPLGGVSDITNRGDPSRLLMTELAWDDMTFAVRLAQGEALYMRRESPPAEPPPQRVIVLDAGIFMWGKPRLFALGAALALQRQKSVDARVFTVAGGALVPVSLTTVDSIRRQLTLLEAMPHPGPALSGLGGDAEHSLLPSEEVFLITHPSALEMVTPLPVWQALASRAPLHSLEVDRDGSLTMMRHSLAGARVLARVRIDLDQLLGVGAAPAASLTCEDSRLPHFYRQHVWPLYHPVAPAEMMAFHLGGQGYVGVSKAGCVCHWTLRGHTGRVLLASTPAAPMAAVAVDPEDADTVFLMFSVGREKGVQLHVVSLKGARPASSCALDIRQADILGVRLQSGALVVHRVDGSQALSLRDGQVLASMSRSSSKAAASLPWYDGEKFHGDSGTQTRPLVTRLAKVTSTAERSPRISHLAEVGFSQLGGLIIRKEKGRMYQLELKGKGALVWARVTDAKATFRPLQPMHLPGWPDHGLSQAEFSDGRRVIYDPRGFLHVIGSTRHGYELSLVLVKKETAAWQRTGFFYGNPQLLWDEEIGASVSLKAVCKQLFLSCPEPGTLTMSSSQPG